MDQDTTHSNDRDRGMYSTTPGRKLHFHGVTVGSAAPKNLKENRAAAAHKNFKAQ